MGLYNASNSLVTCLECLEKGVRDFAKELLHISILRINKMGPMQLAERGTKA